MILKVYNSKLCIFPLIIRLGTFFVPVLPGFNVLKLVILLYCRSWAVVVCNIPHERVFKASKSNNFYYAISLLMLFLVTFAVAFLLVVMSPSNDCGPFRFARLHQNLNQIATKRSHVVYHHLVAYWICIIISS